MSEALLNEKVQLPMDGMDWDGQLVLLAISWPIQSL